MPTLAPPALTEARPQLDDWLARCHGVIADVKRWAQEENWSTHEDTLTMRQDPDLGEYQAPYIRVRLPGGEVHVEPVAWAIAGRYTGRIDLTSFPMSKRCVLVGDGEGWKVRTDDGKWVRSGWSKKTFVRLARELVLYP